MNPVVKALWFIESHFAQEITLEDIAVSSGVSRFSISRAFGAMANQSIMRYVRGRRLSEAARFLAEGERSVLSVALDAGYGSHEAFTRAFRDQFGVTPESVRAQRHTRNLSLVEPISMTTSPSLTLKAPRIENGRARLVAGLAQWFSFDKCQGMPLLWQKFVPWIGHVPGQSGYLTYGVRTSTDESGNFEYLAGVEVSRLTGLPAELSHVQIPEGRYAVFTHEGHIASIGETVGAIWSKGLAESGYEAADSPDFELYDHRFNPATGTGIVEIWIPVKS